MYNLGLPRRYVSPENKKYYNGLDGAFAQKNLVIIKTVRGYGVFLGISSSHAEEYEELNLS
jgi:hypothetical protein